MIRPALFVGVVGALCCWFLAPSAAQERGQLSVLPVRGDVYMISSQAANTTVQIGRDGVLVVDTQSSGLADALLGEIRKLSDKPIRMIINTTVDADHVGGNATLKKSGGNLVGGNRRAAVVYGSEGSPIFAFEKVLSRLAAQGGDGAGWPTDTYFVAQKDMFFNGEPVQLMHVPAAHSDSDSIVVFRRTDVISVGNIYAPGHYPLIDVEKGGTVNGVIAALNRVIDLTVPEFNEEGGTMVVPGRGHLADEADVAEYRDMVTIVRDRVREMVKKGMSLEQVRSAKPTADYDVVYGERDGQAFIEAAYRTLGPAKPPVLQPKVTGGRK